MQIKLTWNQAADLDYKNHSEFIRAAFYTGHSLIRIKELTSGRIHERERLIVIELAYKLGMTDADTVRII